MLYEEEPHPTEKHYRRITGYEHLWMLKAHLDEEHGVLAELQKAG